MNKVDFSSFFNLNLTDLVKGLIMTVLGAVVTAIYTAVQNGGVDWHSVWKVAVAAGLSYLIKNLFTPAPEKVVVDPSKTSVEYERK